MFQTSSKIWLINISLAAAVVFLGIMSYEIWIKKVDVIPVTTTAKNPPPPERKITERTISPDTAYGVIPEKNLFFSNRSEALPKELKPDTPKIPEKPIYLYGVVVLGEKKQALISNPDAGAAASGKPVRDKWIKVGDAVGSLSVADIQQEKIVLTDGASRREILLYDKNKPARRVVAQKPSAPNVVGTQAATPGASANPPAGSTAPAPVSAPAVGGADGKSASAPEYQIINTPFGQMKRRIK
jgi:hypothetical protein